MSNQFHIMKSNRKNKKYIAMFKNGTNIHFGDNRYEDFTIHKDTERKRLYLLRHGKEDWTNPYSAGSLSRWILWNLPSERKERFNFANLVS